MKKKRIKITIFAVIVIIILLFIIGIYEYNKKIIKQYKELFDYYECTFYEVKNSKEEGFEKDIYVKIPYPPVDSDGTSNQYYYEQIIKALGTLLNKENFIIMDKHDLAIERTIRVRFEDGEAKYTIDGDNNYYENQQIKMDKSYSNHRFNNKSEVLKKIINNNWIRSNIKEELGTAEENKEGYDYYKDEGYRIKTVNLKIYNIIFDKNYRGEIIDGITTGLTNVEIREKLGKPSFENRDANILIGYLTQEYYIFFCNGEISIYRIEEFDEKKNDEFSKLVSTLIDNNDYNVFLSSLTDLYSDYTSYTNEGSKIEIDYPLRGFRVNFENGKKSGITIYNNYRGKVSKDITIEGVKKGNYSLPSIMSYESKDFVFISEMNRIIKEYDGKSLIKKESNQ